MNDGTGIAIAAVWLCVTVMLGTGRANGCGLLILLGAALVATATIVGVR